MSVSSLPSPSPQIAVHTTGRRRRGTPARAEAPPAQRPLIRYAAFTALAAYGVIKWGTMLKPAPGGRLLGLLGLTIGVAVIGGFVARRSRLAALLLAVIAIIAMFPIAGVPFAWIRHVRIALIAQQIGEGISALPRALVPYNGINQWIRTVILLGAAVLLLDAALVLAFTPKRMGDLRRAAAALPLITLAVVPMTLVRPRSPYLDGLVLFVLIAAFVWGERIRGPELGTVAALAVLTGVAGVLVAPALDTGTPWLDYEAIAGKLSPADLEQFAWNQSYGPLNWPRTGHEILDVQAKQGDYWKAANLDVFNGYQWEAAPSGTVAQGYVPVVSAAALKRWTQTIKVTLKTLNTSQVIAAGYTLSTQHLPQTPDSGSSPGTTTVPGQLGPGDSYTAKVYSPRPSGAELAAAGPIYASELPGEREMMLPATHGGPSQQILFGPFHSDKTALVNLTAQQVGAPAEETIDASPYGEMYNLAQLMAQSSTTQYDYVQNVLRLLAKGGYTYNEHPPSNRYPLESFLFGNRLGYCQQFSGAAALLLRMGGVPARVAAGFTTGTVDGSSHQYVVTDINAHDWIEVFFQGYGWVRFDPTPAVAPARGGKPPEGGAAGDPLGLLAAAGTLQKKQLPDPTAGGSVPAGGARATSHAGLIAVLVIAGVLLLLALFVFLRRRRSDLSEDELLRELERALARSGRPIDGGVTLAELEKRFRSAPAAAGYIHAVRMARYAGMAARPTFEQRRALREQLRAGLGLPGTIRAMWALPPEWATWAAAKLRRTRRR